MHATSNPLAHFLILVIDGSVASWKLPFEGVREIFHSVQKIEYGVCMQGRLYARVLVRGWPE